MSSTVGLEFLLFFFLLFLSLAWMPALCKMNWYSRINHTLLYWPIRINLRTYVDWTLFAEFNYFYMLPNCWTLSSNHPAFRACLVAKHLWRFISQITRDSFLYELLFHKSVKCVWRSFRKTRPYQFLCESWQGYCAPSNGVFHSKVILAKGNAVYD